MNASGPTLVTNPQLVSNSFRSLHENAFPIEPRYTIPSLSPIPVDRTPRVPRISYAADPNGILLGQALGPSPQMQQTNPAPFPKTNTTTVIVL